MLAKSSGNFLCSFTADIVVIRAKPDLLKAIQIVVLIFNPLLFGTLAAAKGNRKRVVTKLRESHTVNLAFAQNNQTRGFVQWPANQRDMARNPPQP